jgi:hypothetical protein
MVRSFTLSAVETVTTWLITTLSEIPGFPTGLQVVELAKFPFTTELKVVCPIEEFARNKAATHKAKAKLKGVSILLALLRLLYYLLNNKYYV